MIGKPKNRFFRVKTLYFISEIKYNVSILQTQGV